jgi:hypothetical protein
LSPLDDRGLAYVRHGAPDDVASLVYPGVERRSWFYHDLDGGRTILEFVRDENYADYFLADPGTECQPEPKTRISLAGKSFEQEAKRAYALHIASFDNGARRGDRARKLIGSCSATMREDTTRAWMTGSEVRTMIAQSVYETESAVPRPSKPINALVNSYVFREGSKHEVITFLAAQTSSLHAVQPRVDGYGIAFSTSIENPATHDVQQADSLYTVAPGTRGSDITWFVSRMNVGSAGSATIRTGLRSVSDTTRGQFLLQRKAIPDLSPGRFSMSDIVLGALDGSLWTRGSITMTPLPAHTIARGQQFKLFYELYDIDPSEGLSVKIEVTPIHQGGIIAGISQLLRKKQAMSLAFREPPLEATGRRDRQVLRAIGADLQKGPYTMMVTVTRESDRQSVSARTNLEVR